VLGRTISSTLRQLILLFAILPLHFLIYQFFVIYEVNTKYILLHTVIRRCISIIFQIIKSEYKIYKLIKFGETILILNLYRLQTGHISELRLGLGRELFA